MRGRIRRRTIETDMDKKILTGLIVSDIFCSEMNGKVKTNYFKTDYSRIIASWVLDYYKKYKTAPGKHIKDIYEIESASLKEEEAELIKSFLKELSNKYEDEHENIKYLGDRAIEYFKERALLQHYEGVQSLVTLGKIKEAEALIRNFKEVAKTTTEWFNPFDPKVIESVFDNRDEDNLFRFPGALGKFMGMFKRGWLVGFMAPMKRGKSWWLQEISVQSAMNGYKTVFISLEMGKREVSERLYKRISALGDEDEKILYPCFDCQSNQDGSCLKRERKNKKSILLEDGSLPAFSSKIDYEPCTWCRDNDEKGFFTSTWFKKYKVKRLTKLRSKQYSQGLVEMYGDNLRVLAYPANTANTEDIKRDLEELEYMEDFVPSTIVIDYADILRPEHPGITGREKENATWIMMKSLSQVKHCLVVTGTQSSRKSIYKKNVMQDDTSEDIRKIAHCDAMLTLNQTGTEEENGIMRLGISVHRHKKYHERDNVMVIYSTTVGQPLLDSEFIKTKEK